MENAAREGAHFLLYDPEDPDNGFPNTIEAVKNEARNSGVTIEDADITVQCWSGAVIDNNCPPGSTVEVIVTNEYAVSVFSYFLGPITMLSNARMLVP